MSFFPTYCIQAEWGRDTVSPSDIRARIVEMLHGLGQLVPSKDHWRFVDGDDFKITPSAEATADIGPFLKRNIRATGVGKPDSREGYLLVLIGSEDDSDTVAGNDLHVMAVVGSEWSNSLRFQIGDTRHPNDFSLITYPIYKAALELLASVWACPGALAHTFDSSVRPARPRTPFDGAWIAYLSAPLVRDLIPPPEIVAEGTSGGGMI